MGDRVEALEKQMDGVETTLQSLIEQMQTQSHAISELGKQLGKQKASPKSETTVEASSVTESRLAGKKVKLPVFYGEDPVAWITRADIYFDVQNTPDEMRVKLSQLSMEGATIRWFNLLL
ncbi:retrotransposon-related protein, partial [Trifolium pratense]